MKSSGLGGNGVGSTSASRPRVPQMPHKRRGSPPATRLPPLHPPRRWAWRGGWKAGRGWGEAWAWRRMAPPSSRCCRRCLHPLPPPLPPHWPLSTLAWGGLPSPMLALPPPFLRTRAPWAPTFSSLPHWWPCRLPAMISQLAVLVVWHRRRCYLNTSSSSIQRKGGAINTHPSFPSLPPCPFSPPPLLAVAVAVIVPTLLPPLPPSTFPRPSQRHAL